MNKVKQRKQSTRGGWTHPVGTPVRYWSVLPPSESFPPFDTVTRSEAWALGDGSVVVLIKGRTGGVWVDHLEVIK